jgi:hypothetical protein
MAGVVDDSGEREQPGTDLKPGPGNGVHVDGETQLVVFQKELNRAAALRKTLGLPDHKHTRPPQAVCDLGEVRVLSVADENKLTGLDVLKVIDPPGQQVAIIDGLSADDFIEGAAKRVVSEHAESDRSFFVLKRIRRPLDESCEVKKKRRFDLVLDRWAGLWLDGWCAGQREESHSAEPPAKTRSPRQAAGPFPAPQSVSQSARTVQSDLLSDQNVQVNLA